MLTVTFPKFSVDVLGDKVPCWEATPVPVSETVRGRTEDWLLAKAILPVAVPVAVGVKMAV
jgi:hypothetical protein